MKSKNSMVALVEKYLAYRRSLGFQLTDAKDGGVLLRFGKYVDENGHMGPITTDLIVGWAKRTKNSPTNRARRFNLVRDFAEYRALFDPATEVPPKEMLGSSYRRRATPYIYSDDEIVELLKAASTLRWRWQSEPQKTYVAMFGLLACTGLRVSEALALTDEDVDLSTRLLRIRNSKFGKSRFVPLHPSAADALARYRLERSHYPFRAKPKAFFTDQKGPVIPYHRVRVAFVRVRRKLGWDSQGRTKLPRIHDLRHTFAVRRLLLWYEEGANIDQKIPALATYLGHVNPTKTYWYLTAVPELLAVAGKRFERFCPSLMGGES